MTITAPQIVNAYIRTLKSNNSPPDEAQTRQIKHAAEVAVRYLKNDPGSAEAGGAISYHLILAGFDRVVSMGIQIHTKRLAHAAKPKPPKPPKPAKRVKPDPDHFSVILDDCEPVTAPPRQRMTKPARLPEPVTIPAPRNADWLWLAGHYQRQSAEFCQANPDCDPATLVDLPRAAARAAKYVIAHKVINPVAFSDYLRKQDLTEATRDHIRRVVLEDDLTAVIKRRKPNNAPRHRSAITRRLCRL